MYIIQEIQTDTNGTVTCFPPIIKATRNEAESEYHIKAGYAAIGTAAVQTVMCYTENGFEVLPPISYKHAAQAQSVAEPAE